MTRWKQILIAGGGIGAGLALATSAGAVFAGKKVARKWRANASLKGEVVLITGGSRGLGLAMAREFAREECHLALCARNEAELARAKADLEGAGARVLTVVCDVSDRESVQRCVRQVAEEFGRIDVLVNNAGVIQVGPAETMSIEEFETAMGVIFWGALYATMAVLPEMKRRASGRIVNITSIGGKVSVPHLLPYSCAKFAAVALSEGLRTELAPFGISVTTAVPGLMRTGSHVNAQFKGKAESEFAWFSLGAATPVISISAERAARAIVRAAKKGRAEVILSAPAQLAARVHGLAPELTAPVLDLVNRYLLPQTGNSPLISGKDAEKRLNSRVFRMATGAGRAAGERLNENPA